jgi:hypothetical protein
MVEVVDDGDSRFRPESKDMNHSGCVRSLNLSGRYRRQPTIYSSLLTC